MGTISVTETHTLCKWHHLFYWRLSSGPASSIQDESLRSTDMSLWSPPITAPRSPLSFLPGRFWRVPVSYFEASLSIWAGLLFSHDCTFGASILTQCCHVPLVSHCLSFRGADSEAHRRVDSELQNPDVKTGVFQESVTRCLCLGLGWETYKKGLWGCQCGSLLNAKLMS